MLYPTIATVVEAGALQFNCTLYCVACWASSWSTSVSLTPLDVAVNVTDCVVVTADAVAVNPALDAPAATVRVLGTCRAVLLLDKVTTVELVAAPLKFTEHASVVGPVKVWVPHEILLNVMGGAVAG